MDGDGVHPSCSRDHTTNPNSNALPYVSVCLHVHTYTQVVGAAAYNLTFQVGFATTQLCEAIAIALQSLIARELGLLRAAKAADPAQARSSLCVLYTCWWTRWFALSSSRLPLFFFKRNNRLLPSFLHVTTGGTSSGGAASSAPWCRAGSPSPRSSPRPRCSAGSPRTRPCRRHASRSSPWSWPARSTRVRGQTGQMMGVGGQRKGWGVDERVLGLYLTELAGHARNATQHNRAGVSGERHHYGRARLDLLHRHHVAGQLRLHRPPPRLPARDAQQPLGRCVRAAAAVDRLIERTWID